MPLYLGNKQLSRNFIGSSPIREIYFGNKTIMGFVDASYSADEMVGTPIDNSSVYPEITGTGSRIVVSTKDYTPGYGYTKYFCDYMEYTMMYSGDIYVFDKNGNELISIVCTVSWSFAKNEWTLTCKVTMFGKVLMDVTNKSTNIDSANLNGKIYYDTSSKQWVFERNGSVVKSDVVEWQPTYFRLTPKIWFLISTASSMFFDGNIAITKMNRAVGYPNAK